MNPLDVMLRNPALALSRVTFAGPGDMVGGGPEMLVSGQGTHLCKVHSLSPLPPHCPGLFPAQPTAGATG